VDDQFSIPLQYEMTEEETQAYQLSLLWQKLTVEYFPNMRLGPGNTLRKTGDPRKSALFKAMIRMIRRTRGIVAIGDLKFWMHAQLYVCKRNDEECYVTPNMCVGGAAERRWGLYQKWLKAARERRVGNANPQEEKVAIEMVRSDLDTSLNFLKKHVAEVTPQFLEERHTSGDIDKWLKFGFIRPYFVALSPTLQRLGAKVTVLSGLTKTEVIEEHRKRFPKDQ
jgi:hypothetical protein